MSSKTYFLDLGAKRITLPDSRYYDTPDGVFASSTTILTAKAKNGLINWQLALAAKGVDVKDVSEANMDSGTKVHDASERIMRGEIIKFYNEETGEEQYDLFGEWIPICRFVKAYKELEIKPILLETTIWSKEHKFAGTMDLFCSLRPDKKKKERVFALVDLKRSSASSPEYHFQLASYYYALHERIKETKDMREYILKQAPEFAANPDFNTYLLLLNVSTEKGWRLTEVDNVQEKFRVFNACQVLWNYEHPSFDAVKAMYPTEIGLGGEEDEKQEN